MKPSARAHEYNSFYETYSKLDDIRTKIHKISRSSTFDLKEAPVSGRNSKVYKTDHKNIQNNKNDTPKRLF